MGLIDNFAALLKGSMPFKIQLGSKSAPSFNVTELLENQDYTKLLESDNYLDQYIGWTYKAVSLKASACAQVEPKLYYKTTVAKTDEITFDDRQRGQMLRDLYRFNEEQTLAEGRELIHLHLGLAGIAFVYFVDGLFSKDFYVLNPERFSVVSGKNGLPVAYKFWDVDGNVQEIPRRNILVFRHPNPKNWVKGWSPVFASMYAHNSWEYAQQLNMNTFANQGKMQGILTFLGVSSDQKRKIERTLRMKYQGTKNAGKILVTNSKPDWIPITNNMKDLEYISGLEAMRTEILSIQGVPEPLAVANAKYNNVEWAEKNFAKYTVDPLLKRESAVYTEQLIPRYFGENTLESSKMYLEFPSTIPVDVEKDVEKPYAAGVIKLNEARRKLGYDDDPENGDKYAWELGKAQSTPVKEGDVDNSNKSINNEITQGLVLKLLSQQSDKSLTPEEQRLALREELRQTLFKRLVANEEKFLKTTQKFFKSQSKRVVNTVKSVTIKSTLEFNSEAEVLLTIKAFKDVYDQVAEDSRRTASELVGNGYVPLGDKAQARLDKNLEYFAKEITKTTKDDLDRILKESIESSWSSVQTAEMVDELFKNYYTGTVGEDGKFNMSRAETIARTESNKIKSFVSYDRFKGDKEVKSFEWLATGGSGSRATHNAVNGHTRRKGEFFVVDGEKMRYPHDDAASAKNIVNCRCDILPGF